jgi:hypothetical protein
MPIIVNGTEDKSIDSRTHGEPDGGKAGDSASDAPHCVVIVLANHKGGVTRTTSPANLGAMLAEAGRRVLVVDCDPQANLSEAFGWGAERPGERLEDLLVVPDAARRFRPPPALDPNVAAGVAWRGRLRIIPCTDVLADIAADLPANLGAGYETRLAEVLLPLRARFDLILLDTPPGLGNLSGMAVLAADALLIPALAADLDVSGAGNLYDLVEARCPRAGSWESYWQPASAGGGSRATPPRGCTPTTCASCRCRCHGPYGWHRRRGTVRRRRFSNPSRA